LIPAITKKMPRRPRTTRITARVGRRFGAEEAEVPLEG